MTDDELFAEISAGNAPTLAAPAEAEDDMSDLLVGAPAYVRDRFTVADESSANWVVNKMLGYDEQIERITEQYLAMIGDIKKDRERFERRFKPELEAWFDEQPKKGKSLKLLAGTLQKRTVVGGPSIVDEKLVLEWAEVDLPDAIKSITVTKLDKDLVRKHMKATGEIPTGAEWRPDRETFNVTGLKAKKED